MLAGMRRTSSKIPPVLSSFPSLFRLQKWTGLNHSPAGGEPCGRFKKRKENPAVGSSSNGAEPAPANCSRRGGPRPRFPLYVRSRGHSGNGRMRCLNRKRRD
jgi:hypothetical protein